MVGGVGVWWPGRNLQDGPLNNNEENVVTRTSVKGVMLSATLLGHRASSTRAELGDGMADVFAAKAATHQGTDSMAYLLKATQILKGVLPNKPWAILTDCDIWEDFERNVNAKGANAVNITKVKGHATDKMVADGKVRNEHKEGTDALDEAADKGVEQHGNDLLELSTFFAQAHGEYGKMLRIPMITSLS